MVVAPPLLAGFYIYERLAADRIIESTRASVAARIEELRRTTVIRESIYGPASDGNSWDVLVRALKDLTDYSEEELDAFPILSGVEGFNPDVAALDALLDRMQPALEEMRRGLTLKEVKPEVAYEAGMGEPLPLVTPAIKASKMLADAARLRHRQGRHREAMDVLFLCLGMSQDFSVRGTAVHELVRIIGQTEARRALRELLGNHNLDAQALKDLARVLDVIASQRAGLTEIVSMDFLLARSTLLIPAGKAKGPLGGLTVSLRYGFSLRIMLADAFRRIDAMQADLARVESCPDSEKESAARLWKENALRTKNPIIELLVMQLDRFIKSRRDDELDARLARVSTALALFESERGKYPGALQELVPGYLPSLGIDSLSGKRLAYKVTPDSATVYAFGRDGDDDGARLVPDYDFDADGDIVWTVKRKK